MEFNEKLQNLRKQKGYTQEELANALYVSRTAISKWESGRGYPNIDSLKSLAELFSVTVDELLSSDELLNLAERDKNQTKKNIRNTMFALLDVSMVMLLFLPLFAQRKGGVVQEVSLLIFSASTPYLKLIPVILLVFTMAMGIFSLAFKNAYSAFYITLFTRVSLVSNAVMMILFIISLQPYAAIFVFAFLTIKVFLIIK